MRLAAARRAKQDNVLAVLDEMAGREGLDLLFVERGLVAEVEGLEALDEREARQARPHGDVLGGLGGHFLGEDEIQEVGVGGVSFVVASCSRASSRSQTLNSRRRWRCS